MKKLLSIIFLALIIPQVSFGAIAYTAISAMGQAPTATTDVTNFNCNAATNGLIIVGIVYQDTSDQITGVTYGGQALTRQLYGNTYNNGERAYIYTKFAPLTGSNTIRVTKNGTTKYVTFYGTCYTGVSQTSSFATSTQNGTATTMTSSVLTPSDNNWLYFVARAAANMSNGADTTLRSSGTSQAGTVGDSNGPFSPIGTYSQTVTKSGASGEGIAVMSFEPVASAPAATTPDINNIILFE